MPDVRKIKVLNLSESIRMAENFAKFHVPIGQKDVAFLAGYGLEEAAHRAVHCMGWVWRQWLLGASRQAISKHIEPFVLRGLELRERSKSYDYLAVHDLFLLHCAIFGSSDAQLKVVAQAVADGSGDKGVQPQDNGELYAAAWCGMVKYWILGDQDRAVQQSNLIWGACRDSRVRAAPKSLVTPWLSKNRGGFIKAQLKDFERLWNRARKDSWTVKGENATEVVVTTDRYQIGHQWCWSHCGMALLAHRQGVEVVTDPFWFPRAALGSATNKEAEITGDPDQLRMF